MTVEKDYQAELTIGDVTIDRRDIEMLDAIDDHGSMHAAADELGRSYARLQRRVVALEDAVGAVTERRRGGADGGGTELTPAARNLRRQFERHQTELDGVARATESVFPGTVVERTGELGTVETPVGRIVALVPADGASVQVNVRSDAVVLSASSGSAASAGEADQATAQTSLRNQFTGTVTAIDAAEAIASVTLDLGEGQSLQTVITRTSLERLALESGVEVQASFKATAARAIPVADDR